MGSHGLPHRQLSADERRLETTGHTGTDAGYLPFVAEYEGEVPGAAPQDCGNYLLHDLPMAKWESAKYLHEVLEQMKEENMKYPENKGVRD